jgi:hypothetical protein
MPDPLPTIVWRSFCRDVAGRTLVPGNVQKLIKLEGEAEDPMFSQFRDDVRAVLKNTLAEVSYTNVYGIKYPATMKHSASFRRNLLVGRRIT